MATRDVNATFVYPKTPEDGPPPKWQIVVGEWLGRPECPYLRRWSIQTPLGSFRLHHWLRSDDKRNKHDHPSDFITLVLKGSYTDLTPHGCPGNAHKDESTNSEWECMYCGQTLAVQDNGSVDLNSFAERMTPGSIRFRKAEHQHTVAVDPSGCWTLLYFFPDRRKWGFWVPRKSDGKLKFKKANKYFLEHGHHPCDQP